MHAHLIKHFCTILKLSDEGYHDNRISSDPPHLAAWIGDCASVELHPEDQGQLPRDAFAYNPSKLKREKDKDRISSINTNFTDYSEIKK